MTKAVLKSFFLAKRNLLLASLIILFSGLILAQVSFQKGFSRGALEWRDAKHRFFELEQQIKKQQATIATLQKENLELSIERQQLRFTNDLLKQDQFNLHKSLHETANENALYKKILAPDFNKSGIQINSVQIYPMKQTGRFRYEVLLAKFSHHKQETAGTMQLSLQGVQYDELIQIPFEVLVKEHPKGQNFKFRYYQLLKGQLQLPQGFTPESVQISLIPKDKKQSVTNEDFPWLTTIG